MIIEFIIMNTNNRDTVAGKLNLSFNSSHVKLLPVTTNLSTSARLQ